MANNLKVEMETPDFMELLGLRPGGEHDPLNVWVPVVMSLMVGVALVLFSRMVTRKLEKVPGKAQGLTESIVEGLSNFFYGVLGEHAHRYVPLLGSLFLYILLMNYWAMIPGMGAATSKLSTTVGLAGIVFCVTHYEGCRAHGVGGYLKHFFGEPLWLAPLMFPIHVIGEFARPLSLSLRLFGNIMGEDTLVAVMVSIGVFLWSLVKVPLPIQFPLYFLGLLAGLIQAVVFSLLSSIYIGGAVGAFEEHGDEDEEHGHEGHDPGAHAHAH